MATSFPTGLDAIQRVVATDLRNAPGKEGHVLHNNVCDAIEALQAKVGIDGSTVPASIDKRLSSVETLEQSTLVLAESAYDKTTLLQVAQTILSNSYADVLLLFITDSTGDEADEFVRVFAETHLKTAFPVPRISFTNFNTITNNYPFTSVVNEGEGEPYVTVSNTGGHGWACDPALISDEGAELDVWVDAALLDWGSDAKEQTLLARWGAAGYRSWRLFSTFGGSLCLEWSANGTNSITATCSTAYYLASIPDSARRLIRATLKCDNGSGAYEVKFYASSTDATAFVQVGSTITGGATTSIFNAANQTVEIGSKAATNNSTYAGSTTWAAGTFYRAFASSAITGGPNRLPVFIRSFTQPYGASGNRSTGRNLAVYNAAVGGVDLSSHFEATQAKREIPIANFAFVWVSSIHNEGYVMQFKKYRDDLASMITAIGSRIAFPMITMANTNPRYSPANASSIQAQSIRNQILRAYCEVNHFGFCDLYAAYGTNSALVESDGVHPTAAGSAIGAAEVARAFGIRT